MRRILPFIGVLISFTINAFAQSNPQVMMQGWYWDYPKTANNFSWADTLRLKAQALRDAGVTHMWFPPHTVASFGTNSNGYDPKDLFIGNQTTGLGTRPNLDAMLSSFTAVGIKAVADMIYNHRDGGRPEVNAPVKNYVTNFSTYKGQNSGANPFPSDRMRMALPVTAAGIGASRTFYIKVSSATGQYGGKAYQAFFWTSKRGATVNATINETKPNGGGDCSQPSQAGTLNQAINSGIPSSGCGTVEFAITVNAADINAVDSLYMSFINPNGNYGDQRVYGIWNGSSDVASQLLYQTYTDFTNMPSAPTGTITIGGSPVNVNGNYNNFKPNNNNATGGYLLSNSWDDMQFFYDYDQVLNSGDNNAARLTTTNLLNNWTYWNYETLGVRGLRMDAVKNFSPFYVTQLLNNMHSTGRSAGLDMVVGEFWDSSTNIRNWLSSVRTGLNSGAPNPRAFDFPLRYALRDACDDPGNNVRNVIFNSLNRAGEAGFNVVTFVNNHDFRDNSGGNSLTQNNRNLAYAYILTNNQLGTPTIFYPDYYGYPAASGGQFDYHPTTATNRRGHQSEIDRLLKVSRRFITGSAAVSYLNDYGGAGNGPSAPTNFLSGSANKLLLYQLSSVSAVGGKDVIVAINFDSNPIRVDHNIAIQNGITTGTRFGDVLGRSNFPFAQVDNQNRIFIDLPAKSYSVWVRDAVPLSITLGSTTVCTGQSSTLTASITGGNGPFSYSFSAGATAIPGSTSLASVTAAGPYSVTVTDDFGVSVTATVSSTFNPLPTISIAPSATAVCAGSFLTLTASGANTYTWTPSNTIGASLTVSPSSTTTYTVTGSSIGGCTATAQVSVTVNALPVLGTVASTSVGCFGGTGGFTVSASNGTVPYTFSLNSGTSNQTGVFSGLSAGSYTVSLSGANSCSAASTTVVPINQPASALTSSLSPSSTAVCGSVSVTLTGSASGGTGPYQYNFGGGSSATSTSVVTSALGSNVYSLTVTDANGCTAVSTTSVQGNSIPTVNIAPMSGTLTCANPGLTLTASGSGTTYLWLDGTTGASLSVNAPGTYTVTTKDANGCTASTTATVVSETALPTTTLEASATLTCAQTSVTLTATGGASYTLSDGQNNTSGVFAVTASGPYTVTVTSANGCSNTATTTVVSDTAAPTVTLSPSAIAVCAGSSVTLTAIGAATYAWMPGNSTGSSLTVLPSVTTNYTVTGTNANGCTATTQASVTVNSVPTATLTPTSATLTCAQPSVTLTAGGGTSYSFSTGQNGTTNTLSVSTSGTYSVVVANASGCTASASASVASDNALPTVSISPTSGTLTCTITSLTLTASGSGTTYSWTGGTTGASLNVNAPGTYTVTTTSANGCTNTATATVMSDTAVPTVEITPTSTTFCGSLVLTASGTGFTGLLWNTGAITSSITVTATGPYSVTATGTNGCTATATNSPTAVAGGLSLGPVASSSSVCEGSLVLVPVVVTGGASTLQWYQNGPSGVPGLVSGQTSATLTLSPVQANQSGSYVLVATGGCGSATSTAFNLTVGAITPSVVITFPNGSTVVVNGLVPTITIPAGSNPTMQVSGGNQYERMALIDRINGYELRQVDNNANGIFPITRPGLFRLTITGPTGCQKTVEGIVQFQP